ncbi:hypothetical protein BJ742DRAFT_896373 [Cladochytrium replicatum]|nr:hypothetical protein BJ742DRAFT_896373 [Cladochytrium replicatum]
MLKNHTRTDTATVTEMIRQDLRIEIRKGNTETGESIGEVSSSSGIAPNVLRLMIESYPSGSDDGIRPRPTGDRDRTRDSGRDRSRSADKGRERDRDDDRDRKKSRSDRDGDKKDRRERAGRDERENGKKDSGRRSRDESEGEEDQVLVDAGVDEDAMMQMLGFGSFDTPKGQHVIGNHLGAASIKKQRSFRQ